MSVAANARISVIIPNVRSPIIDQVIAALRAQTASAQVHEIVVVGRDEHSLVQQDGLVRLIEADVSIAGARNGGAAAASGDHLLLLDADCLLDPTALAELLGGLASGYDVVLAGVRPETDNYWTLCHNIMAFPEYLTLDSAGERTSVPSYCLLMPRTVWERVGGVDETLLVAGEDLDWSFRARRAGFRLGCVPSAALRHRPGRATIGAVWKHHLRYGAGWYEIYRQHHELVPFSQAIWIAEQRKTWSAPAFVLLACVYIARLVAQRPHLLRLWFAFPGMVWAQLAWYYGIGIAAAAHHAAETT